MPIDMINVIGNHVLIFMIIKLPKPKRLDMEPPEDVKTSYSSTFSTLHTKAWKRSYQKTLRIRGGMDRQPSDNQSTTIPKLSSSNFMWNGQPSPTLMEDIIYPLYMGLGSIQGCHPSFWGGILRRGAADGSVSKREVWVCWP